MQIRSHIHAREGTEQLKLAERERRAGHEDYVERGIVLGDIMRESDLRAWTTAQLHDACGLDDGVLRDGSRSTETLRAALRHVRELPR